MKTAQRKPLAFRQRQAAWVLVMDRMEYQLLHLRPHMADRAAEIRRWLTLANSARRDASATCGITVEKDGDHEYVDVWVSATGRDRPIVSIALPISPTWRAAHAAYLESFQPDAHAIERAKIIEGDPWLF